MEEEQCREAVLSEDYRDFMLTDRFLPYLREGTYLTQPAGVHYKNVYLPQEEADRFPENMIPYYSIPRCYTPLDMGALNAAGITAVQNYPGLELKGQEMLIGFLDTGIDYPNAVFQGLDGSTRILGIWDQTIQDGNPPEGFCYGSAYTREDINKALRQEDPFSFVPTRDEIGRAHV